MSSGTSTVTSLGKRGLDVPISEKRAKKKTPPGKRIRRKEEGGGIFVSSKDAGEGRRRASAVEGELEHENHLVAVKKRKKA